MLSLVHPKKETILNKIGGQSRNNEIAISLGQEFPYIKEEKKEEPHEKLNEINNIFSEIKTIEIPKEMVSPNENKIGVLLENKEFIFIEPKNNQHIGKYSIYDIIKYIISDYDKKKEILKEIELDKNKITLIEKFMCKKKKLEIIIVEYTESPFTGDIEMMIQMNNMLCEYENTEMKNMIKNIKGSRKTLIKNCIQGFVYKLLNYTIKIIAKGMDSIDTNNIILKEKLRGYTIKNMERINRYVQQEQQKIIENTEKINKIINANFNMKLSLDKKITKIYEYLENIQSQDDDDLSDSCVTISESYEIGEKGTSDYSAIYDM